MQPLTEAQLDEWRRLERPFQIIPSKLVHTIKAHSGKYKCRCVSCGNHEEHSIFRKVNCYAGGADGTTIRAVLRLCAAWSCRISSFDVSTAFLQSKLLDRHKVPTVVSTPYLWRKHQVCSERWWLVTGALYGLCMSPRSWCESRDDTMRQAVTLLQGFSLKIQQFRSDPNLWWVVGTSEAGEETRLGIVVWYGDDALILALPEWSVPLTEWVASLWKTSPPEYLAPGKVLVYNGFGLEQDKDGTVHLHQRSFVEEVLQRYPAEDQAEVPAVARSSSLPEEEGPDPLLTRKGQTLCVELLWLSVRARPDLAYAISIMSQCLAKRPAYAWSCGTQILKYLRKRPNVALVYSRPSTTVMLPSLPKLSARISVLSLCLAEPLSHGRVVGEVLSRKAPVSVNFWP